MEDPGKLVGYAAIAIVGVQLIGTIVYFARRIPKDRFENHVNILRDSHHLTSLDDAIGVHNRTKLSTMPDDKKQRVFARTNKIIRPYIQKEITEYITNPQNPVTVPPRTMSSTLDRILPRDQRDPIWN